MTITADGTTTDGEFTVVDMLAPPGFENGYHTHGPAEVFHVLDGEMSLYVDDEVTRLTTGQTGHVSGGQRHGFRVEGKDTLRAIITLTPAGAEEFFRAVGEVTDERTFPEPREVTEDDLEAIFAVGEEYGFEFFGPLPTDD